MKTKAMLRLGFLLLYTIIMMCCKDNIESEPNNIQTSSIVAPDEAANRQDIPETLPEETTSDEVYICKSAGAKRYHYNQSCRGIKRCTHNVEKVSVKTAKGYGLTVCGYEK